MKLSGPLSLDIVSVNWLSSTRHTCFTTTTNKTTTQPQIKIDATRKSHRNDKEIHLVTRRLAYVVTIVILIANLYIATSRELPTYDNETTTKQNGLQAFSIERSSSSSTPSTHIYIYIHIKSNLMTSIVPMLS